MSDCHTPTKPAPSRQPAQVDQNIVELSINAPPERVWRAMVEQIDRWWLPHFRMAPGSRRVVLEPRVGGRWMECAGPEGHEDGAGILWGTVVCLDPGRSIVMTGHVAPPWGACAVLISMQVAPGAAPGSSTFTATHVQIGVIEDRPGMTMQEGWTELFRDGLKRFCET